MGLGKLLAESGKAEQAGYRFDHVNNYLCQIFKNFLLPFGIMTGRSFTLLTGRNTRRTRCASAFKPIVTATNNIEGQQEHEIIADLTPLPNEPVLNKTTMGAFVPQNRHGATCHRCGHTRLRWCFYK